MKITVRDLCYTAVFTAVICVLAPLPLPLPSGLVPTTLATLVVPLAGILLGPRRGTIAVLVYVLLGAAGLPVFSGYRGGLGMVFGMTGGFILAFPLMSLAAGIGVRRGGIAATYAGLLAGSALLYICGWGMFCLITGKTASAAFAAVVAPFIVTELIKIISAGVLGLALRKALSRFGIN